MEDFVKYIYEVGHLKRVMRSGWWLTGVKEPESVAEHSFRVAIIGYMLAKLEGADPMKVMALCLFHDIHETRINDAHNMLSRYADWKDVEKKVIDELSQSIPQDVRNDIASLMHEMLKRDSIDSLVARDADKLECLFQAREYQSQGFADVDVFISHIMGSLTTDSAKKIAQTCLRVEPKEWWVRLN